MPDSYPLDAARVAALCCLHDETDYLTEVIAHLQGLSDSIIPFAFISRLPWHDKPGDWQKAETVAQEAGATVVVGDWADERTQRQAAIDHLRAKEFTHALIVDADEFPEPPLLDALLALADARLAERVYVHWDTYWKTTDYVIRPRERFTPCYLLDLAAVQAVGGRDFAGGRPLVLGPEYGIVHHLSWVGPESRIRRKLATWGHATEVTPGWWERTWRAWDSEKRLAHLHPTHPEAYGFAERIAVPDLLLPARKRLETSARAEGGALPGVLSPTPLEKPVGRWPTISVVIPVYGGEDELTACLNSLAPLAAESLLAEVIGVDNASPDGCAAIASGYSFVTLLKNETNEGFARASNRGAGEATGEMLLFLNSDAIVPRAGLLRLVQSLRTSGSIGAAGPLTNRAGHGQEIGVTCTSLSTMPLFAEDFAHREGPDAADEDVDMLVGFCLLVRRSVWEEVAEPRAIGDATPWPMGFDERFGLGTFEDNDLCYRICRAGYRLIRAKRAFVHHGGSKTITRVIPDAAGLLSRNESLYRKKWKEDLETGFASHLSGLPGPNGTFRERVAFLPARHPDARRERTQERARQADISLCMIVKNEERVLGEALASASPFFKEMIVVDTGSEDRTVEIAEEAGATVIHSPWQDSFSQARNVSMEPATGSWIFWMDADDTLPFAAGEALQNAVLNAPPDVVAFVVPVQFVDDGSGRNGGGTRVDHVKLFRNLPGLAFEGRIHEQILPSLRQVAVPQAVVARAPEAAVVLHSGYDTSVEGQARKRVRDAKLLKLDLEERPGHPFVLFNLGMTDHYGGVHEQAVDWLRQCIGASGQGESHVRKAYALLAVSLRELGRTEEALTTVEEGLIAVGEDAELRFHAGITLSSLGRFAEARASYEKVVGADISGYFSSLDRSILGYKTMHNLGGVCKAMADYEGAKGWWQRALADNPAFVPSAFDLFGAALDGKDWGVAQSMLGHVEGVQGRDESWAAMVWQLVEGRDGQGAGVKVLETAVREAAGMPGEVGLRLVLARKLLELGNEVEASGHLRWLAERGVAEGAYCLGVSAIRRGAFAEALAWMERAAVLNPGHDETRKQVERLKQILAQ